MKVRGFKKGTTSSTFFDGGSTDCFILDSHAKLQGFHGKDCRMRVTTLSGEKKEFQGKQYVCTIRDSGGVPYEFLAYGYGTITGPLGLIDMEKVKLLFPHLSTKEIWKLDRLEQVDILIGLNHASWHPQRAEKANGDEGDFWIYRGMFGCCLGGSHPLVGETTMKNHALFTVDHSFYTRVERAEEENSYSFEFCPCRLDVSCHKTKMEPMTENCFFELEALGTKVMPKCGGCKCSKCPVPGSQFNFKEQRELDIIKKNLIYDKDNQRWVTEYPWKVPRSTLPKNDKIALQSLVSVERNLLKNPGWG